MRGTNSRLTRIATAGLATARHFARLAIADALICLLLGACGGSSSSKPAPTATLTPTQPATPTATPSATPTPVADTIIFSPVATTLTPSSSSSRFTITLTAYNSSGDIITPSSSNQFNLAVYGVPNGVITPSTQTMSTSSATFNYTGTSFPNNVLIDAWISDPTTGGSAIGQTLVLPQPTTCATASQSYSVSLTSSLPNPLKIKASVGYTNASAIPSPVADYTVDTGSLGTIVPESEIAAAQKDTANGFVIGPGPQGTTCYDSSGNAYWGHYYLAPVDIQTNSGWIQTNPIMVLAVQYTCTLSSCASVPATPPCTTPASLHYIGVGYDRESGNPGELFDSPAQNAFLQVTDANNGTDIGPGYVLTTGGVTVGVNSTSPGGYGTYQLTPDGTHPGEFQLIPGSFSFASPSSQFSGSGIFDVGIDEMLLKLPMAQWPSGTSTPVPPTTCSGAYQVPTGVTMSVTLGNPSSPLVSYSFTTGGTQSGDVPNNVCWQDTTNTALAGTPIVNTGRNPLDCYNYFYQGQCGVVGFQQISPAPSGCPTP